MSEKEINDLKCSLLPRDVHLLLLEVQLNSTFWALNSFLEIIWVWFIYTLKFLEAFLFNKLEVYFEINLGLVNSRVF